MAHYGAFRFLATLPPNSLDSLTASLPQETQTTANFESKLQYISILEINVATVSHLRLVKIIGIS